MTSSQQQQSAFLCLPTELRLQILSYLLQSPYYDANDCSEDSQDLTPSVYYMLKRAWSYSPSSPDVAREHNSRRIEIRSLQPVPPPHCIVRRRSTYSTRCGTFRAQTLSTSYGLTSSQRIHPEILATCRQCHVEGVELLYRYHTFSFGTDVDAMTAFLGDLTPATQSRMRSVAFVKRALPDVQHSDALDWKHAMSSLAILPGLSRLELGIVASKPVLGGWNNIRSLSGGEVQDMIARDERLEWVRELRDGIATCRLSDVQVKAIVEPCAAPKSDNMRFWIEVSKAVDGSFGDDLCKLLAANREHGITCI